MEYSLDMLVCDVVDAHPLAKDILMDFGLPCYRCVVAYHETLAEGLQPHNVDAEALLARLTAEAPRSKNSKKTS